MNDPFDVVAKGAKEIAVVLDKLAPEVRVLVYRFVGIIYSMEKVK
jgi:hypothetical protein